MSLLRRSTCIFAICCAGFANLVAAQPFDSAQGRSPRQARVQVTVVDPSNAIVQDATVTVVGIESATQAVTPAPIKTNDKGMAIVESLPPGRYSVRAEFPGFDIGLLRDIRLRAGDNKHVVVLPLSKLEDSVTVARDAQAAGSDRRSSEFGLALSKEQIDALSDDPSEMQRQIMELAGPDAIMRVDSFEGQQLPPKAQIKSIRVVRDQFAAEASQPGSTFVEIVTQPGIGPLRGSFNFGFRDGSMTGRSQFTDRRGPEQFKNFGGFIGGSLIQGKTSFNASIDGQNNYTTPILNAALPDGMRAETLDIRQPTTGLGVSAVVDHSITRDQILRIGFNRFENTRENLGVGNFDLPPDRAFTNEFSFSTLRLQQTGPLGRRSFINTRLAYSWNNQQAYSNVNAPTIIVQDAFNSGGAQQTSNFDQVQLTFASDVDYVRGMNSWRGGFQIDGQWLDSTNSSNALGTFTFSSPEAYQAGVPVLYTRAIGDPRVSYMNLQGGFYFQDDIRVRKGLTLSPGVRYSIQKRVDDYGAFEPRFGLTWSPFAGGKTTLRGSAGIFHSFLPTFAIEQTLRQDGERQRELVVVNPSYPDPGLEGRPTTTNKYLIGDDYRLSRNYRYSAGIDQAVSPRFRLNVLYNYIHLQQQPRGRNLNAPIDGVRPDPRFANVIEVVTDTEIRRHEVFVNSQILLATPSPALQQKRFNWRRLSMNAGYMYLRARNNSNGFFAVPPTGSVADDWGPGPADAPYRVQVMMTSTQLRNLTANFGFFAPPPTGNVADDWGPGPADAPYRVQVALTSTQLRNLTANIGFFAFSNQPYTLTTGQDDNRDGLINDRPLGVGLRSLRGVGQGALNMRIQYAFPFGRPGGGGGGPIARQIFIPGGPPPPPPQGGGNLQARYRLNVFMTVQNVTNHQNLSGYSGVMTSPFFLQPTNAQNLRSINFGVGMSF